MAENRSNLVHVLNVSDPYSESSPKYAIICDTEELTETLDPQTTETRYICQDTTTTTVTGYNVSFDISAEYNKDSEYVQYISNKFIDKPTGSAANSDYLRFLKTDETSDGSGIFKGIKQPCVIYPTELGGASEDPLGMTVTVNSRGNSISGYITVTGSGATAIYTFSETEPTP